MFHQTLDERKSSSLPLIFTNMSNYPLPYMHVCRYMCICTKGTAINSKIITSSKTTASGAGLQRLFTNMSNYPLSCMHTCPYMCYVHIQYSTHIHTYADTAMTGSIIPSSKTTSKLVSKGHLC